MNTSAYPSTNTPKTPHQSPPTQCQGFTRSTRTRCTRTTPSKSQIPYRCHQHQEEDVDCGEYTEWIDETLSHYTKKRLIDELVKPVSDKDGPGYIYVYQLMEGDGVLDGSMYKIGRTTNISRRLTQWSTRCGLTPHLIAHFYTTPYAHRAERLIHIELSERFGTGPVAGGWLGGDEGCD
ncbi:uncharacterized protein SPPG_04664 [Spizellomyces punctatus DAOM BR117]|uniref:Bacteriophage T5 Orf172 DNA-binding domain-containing protein n=1 Tax=Spizellomyces punctatus (strain DAOM BR117) TaxID=645134 RepID=A0A0L0HGZ0_SPIPD|nr:uncharacterized protein SPPG_04664 [Spizellomyces punctatus DAOM BR117]KND00342.1 hypothetical protein SPPG_04664 [Spizellomyces punctatus DAOM BR117]|eukprot:XP_016608381.1 hypothetical protein SPPG_04664 [Spizellomyces punctatus DAOM BR117]